MLSQGSASGSSDAGLRASRQQLEGPVHGGGEAIVAYYIQPGGRIVPVEILPDDRLRSEAASISEANTQFEEQPGPGGVVMAESDIAQGGRQASWVQQAWETSPLIESRYGHL